MRVSPRMSFEGPGDKLQVLNRTNAAVLKDAYGDDTDAWKNKICPALRRAGVLPRADEGRAAPAHPCGKGSAGETTG
jgi:hypothetical protein